MTPPEDSGATDQPPRVRTEQRPGASYRAVLSIPAFRRLWLAQVIAAFGEAIAGVALPLFAYATTGSPVLASWVFVAQLAPRIVLAPVTGLLADRLDRRQLLLAADLGRALVVGGLPFATQAWQVGLLAMLVAVGTAIARPAELAAVPAVVPPHLLVQALSASQVAGSVVRVVGPAVAAGVIGVAGPSPAFVLQMICFLASFAVVLGLTLPAVANVTAAPGSVLAVAMREIRDGVHAVGSRPMVRATAAVEALWQVVTAVFIIALVVYVEAIPGIGRDADSLYAWLMATFSAGAVVGALLAGRVEWRIGRPRLMGIGYLAPFLLVPAAWSPPLPLLFACWFWFGFMDAWAVIAMQAYLAEAVGDALRGRVYAIWNAIVTAGGAIAAVIIGQATIRLGPESTIGLAGALVGLGTPLLFVVTGAVRAMRQPAATRPDPTPSAPAAPVGT